jgi:hypothetical protein
MKVLEQHPEICIARKKEVNYFNIEFPEAIHLNNEHYGKPIEWYHGFFSHAKPRQKRGELTPCYLFSITAYKDIYEYNKDIRLFAILRAPFARDKSQFLFSKQIGTINPNMTFKEFMNTHRDFFDKSLYFKQISKFLSLFSKEQFLILLLEDIKEDKLREFRKFEDHIGVSHFDGYDFEFKSNVTKGTKYPALNFAINNARKFINQKPFLPLKWTLRSLKISDAAEYVRDKINVKTDKDKIEISEETKNAAFDFYRDDILKLQDLLDRDLSHWLKP